MCVPPPASPLTKGHSMPPQPTPRDGDEDPPDEPIIEVELPEDPAREFYWTDDADEIRRFYIMLHMADADMDAKILVGNMDRVYKWCKTGELPIQDSKPRLKLHDKAD